MFLVRIHVKIRIHIWETHNETDPDFKYWFLSRMTEQEEDEELLSDLNQAKKTVISFDESPPYIKVNKRWFNVDFWGQK